MPGIGNGNVELYLRARENSGADMPQARDRAGDRNRDNLIKDLRRLVEDLIIAEPDPVKNVYERLLSPPHQYNEQRDSTRDPPSINVRNAATAEGVNASVITGVGFDFSNEPDRRTGLIQQSVSSHSSQGRRLHNLLSELRQAQRSSQESIVQQLEKISRTCSGILNMIRTESRGNEGEAALARLQELKQSVQANVNALRHSKEAL